MSLLLEPLIEYYIIFKYNIMNYVEIITTRNLIILFSLLTVIICLPFLTYVFDLGIATNMILFSTYALIILLIIAI